MLRGRRGHIHLYSDFDPDEPYSGLVGCWRRRDTPILEIGDVLEHDGQPYEALPTFVGNLLVVQRDGADAQVAIRPSAEPSGSELVEKQLIGAGAATA